MKSQSTNIAVIIFIIALVVGAVYSIFSPAGSQSLNVSDDKAAEIVEMEFEGYDGSTYRIADMEGQIVILDFWETWCGPCITSFAGFQEALSEWPDKITVLAASPGFSDTEDEVRAFKQENDYDFIYVKAPELARELQINSIPYKILFAPDGSYIRTELGTKGASGEYEALKQLVEKYF